jgi:hypothetical protein
VLGQPGVQAEDLVASEPGAGGIARVVEQDDAGALVHLGQHAVDVGTQVRALGEADLGARGAAGDAVGVEAELGLDDVVAGLAKGVAEQAEDLVRADAEDQPLRLQAVPARDGLAQHGGAGVGVEVQPVGGGAVSLGGGRAAAQRVLVGGQLHRVGEALHLGLARDVGADLEDARLGLRRVLGHARGIAAAPRRYKRTA